jgi:RNA polymerase sigma-70 factor (ECF subfamily)
MDDGTQGPDERRLERLEEALLVAQAQAGHGDAFVQLMNRYHKPLLYYLRRFVPEGDCLDLHQEVWIDAFRGLPSLQIPEAFRVWIYQIARHKAARFIHNVVSEKTAMESLGEEQAQEPSADSFDALDAEAVHRGLALLPPPQREILVLHYLRDLSTDELAVVLDCPRGTIKSRLYHARLALRRVMERKEL